MNSSIKELHVVGAGAYMISLENGQVWREEGFTAVLVTHDVTEAVVLGDRVVLIEDGIVKLEVSSRVERYVTIAGVESCTTDEDCTGGKKCRTTDSTCQ